MKSPDLTVTVWVDSLDEIIIRTLICLEDADALVEKSQTCVRDSRKQIAESRDLLARGSERPVGSPTPVRPRSS